MDDVGVCDHVDQSDGAGGESLLVPGRDERELRMLLHRIQDFQEALAGDGVEAPDACASTSTATEPAPLVALKVTGLSPMIFAPYVLHSCLQDGL